MKRILFFIVCISLIPAASARADTPDKNSQLLQAAKDSNLPDAQTKHKEDKFPLHSAATKGNIEKVKKLIAEGYNVNARNKANYMPLHNAIIYGHRKIAEILVTNGADVNARNIIGITPLMLAVINNHNDIAEMLIANGAEKTIYVAAAQGDAAGVKAFLKKDPNLINATADNDGWSALHWATHQDRSNVIKLLIENGAKVDIRDGINGFTPLYWAVRRGNINAAKLLVENGADVNLKLKHGGTILHNPGTLETARLLVANGADINAKDDYEMTPLHSLAGGRPNIHIIQQVLFWKNGGTAGTWGTDFKKYRSDAERIAAEIAELLIKNGADVNAKNKKGHTPLSLAKRAKNKLMVELLEKYSTKDKN